MENTLNSDLLIKKLGFDPAYLHKFEEKLFIEGENTRRRLINFFVLLLLATVIANYGVLSGSTATVIGAMIVAPLMGPIMATAAAVVMGSTKRALYSLALALIGMISVIVFAIILTSFIPSTTISFTNNGEIISRITPGLYALLTALGAGAAGAFIISREEISDSMGGVAIAISLVPPLCVVGISISQGQWAAATGAFLLFVTNFLAILLSGGIVFLLLGMGRLATTSEGSRMRSRSFTLIVLGTLLVMIPLSLTAYQTVQNTIAQQKATQVVQSWLENPSQHVYEVQVDNGVVNVTVEGSGELKSAQSLVSELVNSLHRRINLKLRYVPTIIQTIESNPSQ